MKLTDFSCIMELCRGENWLINDNTLLAMWKAYSPGWFVAERDGVIIGETGNCPAGTDTRR